jgi:LysR family glycine cleavage system transcriptional activator
MRPQLRDPAYVGALVYFERVASRLSFSGAASDLGVTASAVSHRINRLEGALGKRLFERSPRTVTLTPEGADLLQCVSDALDILRTGTGTILGRKVLRLSIGPYLSVNWLMPRLLEFEQANPGIRVDLLHRTGWPDMKNIDVAIAWYDAQPSGSGAIALFEPECIPVIAPSLSADEPLWTRDIHLLHYRDREAWRQWLKAAGGPAHFANTGEVLDDPNLVLEAAAHRRGAALGFLPFISAQLATGRLVRAPGPAIQSDKRYWLVRGETASRQTSLLVDWLIKQAAKTRAEI